jgi:hypothetical protein
MYFNFTIRNFCKPRKEFKKYFSFYKQLSKYKNVEFEIFYAGDNIFQFQLDFSPITRDHGGLSINLTFLGFDAGFIIYDSRHWDNENWCWEKTTEEETVNKNFDGF